jgi:hypothetical protein
MGRKSSRAVGARLLLSISPAKKDLIPGLSYIIIIERWLCAPLVMSGRPRRRSRRSTGNGDSGSRQPSLQDHPLWGVRLSRVWRWMPRPRGGDRMPGQSAPRGVDQQPRGIRAAHRAGARNRAHRAPKPLRCGAALTLDPPVGAADPQRSLVGMAVNTQPPRQPAKRFTYVALIGEVPHQRVVRAAVRGEDSVTLGGDAPGSEYRASGVRQRSVLQCPCFVVSGEFHGAHVVDRSYAGDRQLRPDR